MPLPKMPNKPAALLSPVDYPKAEKGKSVKPAIALVTTAPTVPVTPPQARTKSEAPVTQRNEYQVTHQSHAR